jgi:hypothetical protein
MAGMAALRYAIAVVDEEVFAGRAFEQPGGSADTLYVPKRFDPKAPSMRR